MLKKLFLAAAGLLVGFLISAPSFGAMSIKGSPQLRSLNIGLYKTDPAFGSTVDQAGPLSKGSSVLTITLEAYAEHLAKITVPAVTHPKNWLDRAGQSSSFPLVAPENTEQDSGQGFGSQHDRESRKPAGALDLEGKTAENDAPSSIESYAQYGWGLEIFMEMPEEQAVADEIAEQGKLSTSPLVDQATAAQKLYLEARKVAVRDPRKALDMFFPQVENNKELFQQKDLYKLAYFALLLDTEGHQIASHEVYQFLVGKGLKLDWLYWRYAYSLIKQKNYTALTPVIEQAITLFPSQEDLVDLYLSVSQTVDLELASQRLQQLKQPYQRLETYLLRAKLEKQRGEGDLALATLEQAYKTYNNEKQVHLAILELLIEEKKWDQAGPYFENAHDRFADFYELYFLETQYLEAQGKLKEALAKAEQADSSNFNPLTRQTKIRLLLLNQNYDEAAIEIEKTFSQGNLDTAFYNWLAQYYILQNRWISAERVLLEGLRKYALRGSSLENDDAGLVRTLADVVENLRDYPRALNIYKILYARQSEDLFVNYALARLNAALKNPKQALEFYQKAKKLVLAKTGENVVTKSFFEDYVGFLIEQKKFSLAKRELASLDSGKKFPWIYGISAKIFYFEGDYIKALGEVNKALSDSPEDRGLLLLEIALFDKLKDHQGVLEYFETQVRNDPYSAFAWKNLLIAKTRKNGALHEADVKDFTEKFGPSLLTEELFSYAHLSYLQRPWKEDGALTFQAIVLGKQEKNWPDKLNNPYKPYLKAFEDLSSVLPSLRDYNLPTKLPEESWMLVYKAQDPKVTTITEAESWLQKAIKLKPSPSVEALLTGIWIEQARYKDALKSLQPFANLYPKSKWLKNQYFLIYESTEDYPKAAAVIQDLFSSDPEDPSVLNNYAWFQLTSKDKRYHDAKKALEKAEKAVKKNRNAAYLDTLAEAYFQNNQLEKAIQTIELALVLDPNNADHFKIQYQKLDTAWRKKYGLE